MLQMQESGFHFLKGLNYIRLEKEVMTEVRAGAAITGGENFFI